MLGTNGDLVYPDEHRPVHDRRHLGHIGQLKFGLDPLVLLLRSLVLAAHVPDALPLQGGPWGTGGHAIGSYIR